jgi:hypothetical protein
MEKCMDVARRFDPTVLSDMMDNGLEDNPFFIVTGGLFLTTNRVVDSTSNDSWIVDDSNSTITNIYFDRLAKTHPALSDA